MTITGIVAAPFTLGGSLTLTAACVAAWMSSGVAGVTQGIVHVKIVKKKKAYPLNVQALAANIKVLSKLLKFGTAFNGAVFPTVSTAAKWLPKFVQMLWAP